MTFLKKNISLILALAIPLAMVGFVAASVYLPSLFIKPQYTFIYVTNDNDYRGNRYAVEDGVIVRHEPVVPTDEVSVRYEGKQPEPKLYIYDLDNDESREISFEQSQVYRLDDSPESPDGFTLTYGNNNSDFFFLFGGGNRDYNTRYLVGNGVSKKLNLKNDGSSYYSGNIRLLGWVKHNDYGY